MPPDEPARNRLLLATSDPDVAERLESRIRESSRDVEVVRVVDEGGAVERLGEARFAGVFVDVTDDPDLSKIQDASGPTTVVALIEESDDGPEALGTGADDWLPRDPGDGDAVERTLRYAIDRAQIATALDQSRSKFENLVESIEDGYFEVDLAGTFTYVNDYLCRLSGYDREEFIGTSYVEFVDDPNAKKIFNAFHVLYETGIPLKLLDFVATRSDDEELRVETSVFLKRDEAGRKIGFWGLLRDVTAQRQAEEELAELRSGGEPD